MLGICTKSGENIFEEQFTLRMDSVITESWQQPHGIRYGTTVVQIAVLMKVANKINVQLIPVHLYSKVLIFSQSMLMKTTAIALSLLKKKNSMLKITCTKFNRKQSRDKDRWDFVLKLSGGISTKICFYTDKIKALILFSSLSFNMLLKKAQRFCVWRSL